MPGFEAEHGQLTCDGVPLSAIADEAGTPVHVYAASVIRERARAFDAAFAGHPRRLHYAIKANATTAILRELRALGLRADANSGGEIEAALHAGFTPGDIVFTGVGKTRAELERAVSLGVAAINAESPGEVGRIAAIAEAHGTVARLAMRVNPDIDAGSHPHISTGRHATKFGMSAIEAAALLRDLARRSAVRVVGLHVHVGSQITAVAPIASAVRLIVDVARSAAADGVALEYLDVGGGLGIAYEPGQPVVSVDDYAAAVLQEVRGSGLAVVLEPGRWIVGPAGVLVTEVIDVKRRPGGGVFVVVDAGMTDLIRPALYGAWHRIEPAAPRAGAPIVADIVGPVCETSDTLGRERTMAPVEVGDRLVVRDTGAYGAVMASTYNRRPTAAEVVVDAGRWHLARRRQTAAELLQWDV